jgi:hypothetical protein
LFVVCGLGLIGLLLHLCPSRLSCLLLGLLIGLALLSSATHRADRRSNGRAFACIPGDAPNDGSSGSTSGCSPHSAPLRLWSVGSGLLLGSLHFRG